MVTDDEGPSEDCPPMPPPAEAPDLGDTARGPSGPPPEPVALEDEVRAADEVPIPEGVGLGVPGIGDEKGVAAPTPVPKYTLPPHLTLKHLLTHRPKLDSCPVCIRAK